MGMVMGSELVLKSGIDHRLVRSPLYGHLPVQIRYGAKCIVSTTYQSRVCGVVPTNQPPEIRIELAC